MRSLKGNNTKQQKYASRTVKCLIWGKDVLYHRCDSIDFFKNVEEWDNLAQQGLTLTKPPLNPLPEQDF